MKKFTISSFEKFSILIETRFLPDAGTTDNVFNLSEQKLNELDLKHNIDHIDMCAERAAVYNEQGLKYLYRFVRKLITPISEDPLLYKSTATGNRGIRFLFLLLILSA